MSNAVDVEFIALDQVASRLSGEPGQRGVLVVFAGPELAMGPATSALLGPETAALKTAAAATRFKGKAGSALDLLAPGHLPTDRLLVLGTASDKELPGHRHVTLGGTIMGKLKKTAQAVVVVEGPDASPDAAAEIALGLHLRAYRFDKYKTKKKDDADSDGAIRVAIAVADVEAARRAAARRSGLAEGVLLARTLVNEPPNVLFPEAFAARSLELTALGVEVEVIDVAAAEKIGMRALLAVGQGSAFESRVVVMRWNGAADRQAQPVAFVGKGVCFDSGGISLKPGAGMEDMKGDMGGAACVVGLMHALASRKAKANVIGIIGLVENMPDGKAQRPGDIVTSLSGQTIEIINTDAEGRLVLADLLWYVQETYKPQFMVNLATLTGAIIVALGTEHAGLFSNNDDLSQRLFAAGTATGEKVWRLPLSASYDKLIDSKFADMKNTGGRHGGSITAAQFLQRFVNDTPWAHLDVAGTAMGAPADEINQSWAAGWGVRLLDRLVSDHYELIPGGGVAEIWFYHLEHRPLDQVLPILLERSLGRGWRVVVQAGGPERVASLDALLWTYADESFLPHGTASDGAPETQPVYLTDGPENPNGAAIRFCLDGVAVPSGPAEGYERIIVLFDGRDDAAVVQARTQWAALKTAGQPLSYWQQADDGRWEKRA